MEDSPQLAAGSFNCLRQMSDLELIFNMLGEAATTEIESGRKVVTSENYLDQPEVIKRIGKKFEE
jgi:hypothetical protein